MSKRILVTGGAGLGSHLCERLLAAGNDVLASTTTTPAKQNIVAAWTIRASS